MYVSSKKQRLVKKTQLSFDLPKRAQPNHVFFLVSTHHQSVVIYLVHSAYNKTSYLYFEFLIKYCFTLKNHDLIWQNLAKNEENPCAYNLLVPPISQNPAKFQLSNHYNVTVWHAAALGKYFCRFLVEKWADDVMPCVPRDKSL